MRCIVLATVATALLLVAGAPCFVLGANDESSTWATEDLAIAPVLEQQQRQHEEEQNNNLGKGSPNQSFQRPLVSAVWRFSAAVSASAASTGRFGHFPRALARLLDTSDSLEEFSVSFTQGRWLPHWRRDAVETELDGYSESQHSGLRVVRARVPAIAPAGAELWAKFSRRALLDNNVTVVNGARQHARAWETLTGVAGGLFCGSLEQMKRPLIATPQLMQFGSINQSETDVLYASLPRESACTENLTPWIKLLPAGRTGFASALRAERLFDGHYASMRTRVWRVWKNAKFEAIRVEQTLVSVLPVTTPPNVQLQTTTLDRILGLNAPNSNHVSRNIYASAFAARSSVRVLLNRDKQNMNALSEIQEDVFQTSEGWAVYNLLARESGQQFVDAQDLVIPLLARTLSTERPVSVSRHLTGHGQARGGVSVAIRNPSNGTQRVRYFDVLPWFMRVYLQSLRFRILQEGNSERQLSLVVSPEITAVRLVPADDHGRPGELEFELWLPALSEVSFTFEFDKAFLHFTEYPPDAHRGYDVGSALVSVQSVSDFDAPPSVIYSVGLLVDLPTPDFSMPYNVITITGTVFAMFFGSVLNLLLRRLGALKLERGDFVSNRPVARAFRLLLALSADPAEEREQGRDL